MTFHRHQRALAIIAACATLGAACAGGDTPDDASAGDAAAGDAAAGDSPATEADEALLVWADQLLAAVGDHETRQAALGLDPAGAPTGTQISAAFGEQADSLAGLGAALPDDPPMGELLISRYQTFVADHANVTQATAALANNPDETAPWAYGDATDAFVRARDVWLESCFALQEVIADNDLGVLGCVGLTGVEDDAEAAFGNMLRAGMGTLVDTIPNELGRTNQLTPGDHRRHLNVNRDSCQPEAEQPKIDEIARYAADIATLIIDDDLGNVAVDIWVLPDTATAVQFTDILERLFTTRRLCMSLKFDTLPSYGQSEEEMAALNLGIGQGYEMTIFDDGQEPITFQVAAANQGNVAALFTAATMGETWTEREIEQIIGNAIVGGSR